MFYLSSAKKKIKKKTFLSPTIMKKTHNDYDDLYRSTASVGIRFCFQSFFPSVFQSFYLSSFLSFYLPSFFTVAIISCWKKTCSTHLSAWLRVCIDLYCKSIWWAPLVIVIYGFTFVVEVHLFTVEVPIYYFNVLNVWLL